MSNLSNQVSYLKGLGLNVDDSNTTHKQIIIPEKFNDVYTAYNALQKKAGHNHIFVIASCYKGGIFYDFILQNRKQQNGSA